MRTAHRLPARRGSRTDAALPLNRGGYLLLQEVLPVDGPEEGVRHDLGRAFLSIAQALGSLSLQQGLQQALCLPAQVRCTQGSASVDGRQLLSLQAAP